MNVSEEAMESLVTKVSSEVEAGKGDEERVVSKIIQYLCRICTKDFEYLFNYILEKNNTLEDLTVVFRKFLDEKEK